MPHNVVYSMIKKINGKRKFISVYFKNGKTEDRKKRDITISFSQNDPLYEKCKKMRSSNIKEIIGTNSYKELLIKAKKESRTLSNYIKHKLRKKIYEIQVK